MTVLDIAWNDLTRSVRSVFLMVFALLLPLLTTGVFFAAFGGLSSGDDDGAALVVPRVLVVNLDRSGQSGTALADILTGKDLSQILESTAESDPAAAREAVDRGEADAAVIIPQGFSAAVGDASGSAAVEVYQDPAETIGPAVVRSVVRQILDGFAGGWVAIRTSGEALASRSLPPDAQSAAVISGRYAEWVRQALAAGQDGAGLDVESVAGAKRESGFSIERVLSVIMAMMMIFYCFFSGTVAAQSILQEQEAGTLARLFTTPVRRSEILAGKFLYVFVTLLIQVVFLLSVSAAVFGIRWGSWFSVLCGVVGTVTLSAGFGIFITSFLKNTKQAGMVYGVVVNLIGWIGISRMFTDIMPGMAAISKYADVVSLFSPQGWAARIWQEGMAGEPVWITLAGMLVIASALFGIGVFKFNRRFAG